MARRFEAEHQIPSAKGLKNPTIRLKRMLKNFISIVVLWILALTTVFYSARAHADIFSPSFDEIRTWNCSLEDEAACSLPQKPDRKSQVPVRILKVRIETDTSAPYLRDAKGENIYFFSEDLVKTSPSLLRSVIERCQFRVKESYCSIRAALNIDRIEKIEEWELQRYQIVK